VFLGKFLDQIPARLPEVTQRFIEYETANPESFTGYFLHAKALNAQSKEPDTARKLLEKAIAINERDAAAHFELGTLFDRLDETVGGIDRVIGFDCVLNSVALTQQQIRHEVSALFARRRVAGFATYGEQFHALHVNQSFSGLAIGR